MFGLRINLTSDVCAGLGCICLAGDHSHQVQRISPRMNGGLKNLRQKKKSSEKALIPLPPTGLVSFFCANPDVVQTNL